jgi:hypothetical protein
MLHWLVLGRQTVNHDQYNQTMGRPRALDWGQAGLVEAFAYPYFCGDQISERETRRAVGPSASSRGGSARIPSISTAQHSRGVAGRGAPGLHSELNRDRKNTPMTFRSRLRSHASAPYMSLLYRRSSLVAWTWKC